MAKILDPYHLLRKDITHPIAGIDDDWVDFMQTFDLEATEKGRTSLKVLTQTN